MPLMLLGQHDSIVQFDAWAIPTASDPIIKLKVELQMEELIEVPLAPTRATLGWLADDAIYSIPMCRSHILYYVAHEEDDSLVSEGKRKALYLALLNRAKAERYESIVIPVVAGVLVEANHILSALLETIDLKVYLLALSPITTPLLPTWTKRIEAYLNRYLASGIVTQMDSMAMHQEIYHPERRLCQSIPFPPLEDTFSQRLLKLIDKKGYTDVEVYKKANVDRKLFSKIRSDPNYHPKKTTAIAFALAMHLNLEETLDFIKTAGYTLSHSNKFDLIIEHFIKSKHYDISDVNLVLYEFDQVLLGY